MTRVKWLLKKPVLAIDTALSMGSVLKRYPVLAICSVLVIAPVSVALASPLVVPVGGLSLSVSQDNPNVLEVPGERVVAISASGGVLLQKQQTSSGGVLFATVERSPFTLYLETDHGHTLTVHARPGKGSGRHYQLQSSEVSERPEARAFEQGAPYEAMLVSLHRTLLGGAIPDGYVDAALDDAPRLAVPGLEMVPEHAWQGDALEVVRYRVTNRQAVDVTLRAEDIWQRGVRSVLFTPDARVLRAGAATWLYLTRTKGVTHG